MIEAHYAKKFREGNYALLRTYSEQYLSVYQGFVKVLERKLRSYSLTLGGLTVLDIGCFTGEFLGLLKDKGVAGSYGLELQPEAVEIASKRLPGCIFQADVFSKDFPAVPCDVITLLGVIEHVIEPVRLLRRAYDLLNQGGVLMLQTPNSASLLAHVMGKFWPPYAPVEHIHLFSKKALHRVLDDMGLVDITFYPHWKKLPIGYVYHMLQHFGPELHSISLPFFKLLPHFVTNLPLPFYAGEMIVTAQKPS
jgi:SAM-dependent methyltransferase